MSLLSENRTYWRNWIVENMVENGGFYLPPQDKKIDIETSEVIYDLKPEGDISTLRLDITDNRALIIYRQDNVFSFDEEEITFFISWALLSQMRFRCRYTIDELLQRVWDLENSGISVIWIEGEKLTHEIDGTNRTFNTEKNFFPETTEIFYNGLRLTQGNQFDYIENVNPIDRTNELFFNFTPLIGDSLTINYGSL